MSTQAYKVKHGEAPLPITTGIRVRKDLPASQYSGTFTQCSRAYFEMISEYIRKKCKNTAQIAFMLC